MAALAAVNRRGRRERTQPTGHQDSTDTGAIDAAATPHIRLLALRMPASRDNPPAPPANLCPGVVIEKAHAMLSSRATPAGVARHGLGEEARGREIGGLGATE